MANFRTLLGSTQSEAGIKLEMAQRLRASKIPDSELIDNLGLYLTRQALSRINFIQEIYKLILPVHGVIMEFGVRWGQNLALFSSLRGIHEPYNYNRKIIGFDTFDGFPEVTPEDGPIPASGDYSVSENWFKELDHVLEMHNHMSPIPQKRKHDIVKGDAVQTVPKYFIEHPETIIAMAYFDFDLYKPTRVCLEAIQPHLTKGSVIAFDELNMPEFPGETRAFKEVLGLSKFAIRRMPFSPLTSYIVIE